MLKNTPFFKVVEEEEGVSSNKKYIYSYNVEFRVQDDAGGFKAIRTYNHILALTSPVFEQQFFGSLSSSRNSGDSTQDNKMEVVNIQGVPFNVFKDFIELIGSGNVNIVEKSEDFDHLFEMLRLADMYQVLDVVDLVKARIAKVKITLADVVKAAIVSEKYKDLLNFEDVCARLYIRCAGVLHDGCPAGLDVFRFISSNQYNVKLVKSLVYKEYWNILCFSLTIYFLTVFLN